MPTTKDTEDTEVRQTEFDFSRAEQLAILRDVPISDRVIAEAKAQGKKVSASAQRAVLRALDDHSAPGRPCWPGQATLAAETNLDERTVRRALRALKEQGFIAIERRRTAAGNTLNHYWIEWSELARRRRDQPETETETDTDQPDTVSVPTGHSFRSDRTQCPDNRPRTAQETPPPPTSFLNSRREEGEEEKTCGGEEAVCSVQCAVCSVQWAVGRSTGASSLPTAPSPLPTAPSPLPTAPSPLHTLLRRLGIATAEETAERLVGRVGSVEAAMEAIAEAEATVALPINRRRLKSVPGAIAWFLTTGEWPAKLISPAVHRAAEEAERKRLAEDRESMRAITKATPEEIAAGHEMTQEARAVMYEAWRKRKEEAAAREAAAAAPIRKVLFTTDERG